MAGLPGLILKITADTAGINKSLDGINGKLNQFGSVAGKVGGLMAGAFAFDKIVEFSKATIMAASDLNEMQSKVNQVFGPGTGHLMDTWAQGAATSMGLSQTAALDAASTFGIFADAAGMSSGKAAGFSQQMTQLAGDLASFNNTSVPDAVQAIGAALRGEMEPIRRYGVMLDDASLKAAAMAQGIYNGNGPLSQQQKIMAASTLIMQQTTKAQGDYARTSDGLANTMRTIQAATDNASASIGGGFLIAIQSMNKAMGGGEGMAGLIENTGQVMGDFIAGLGVLISKVVELAPATDQAAKKVEPLQRNWSDFFAAITNADDPITAFGNVIYWLGATERTAAEAAAANFNAHLILEQGYLDNSNAAKRAQTATEKNAAAQRDAKTTTDALTAAFSRQNQLLSSLTSRIDLEAYYDGLTKALAKSGHSLDITTEKGRTNATTLADGVKKVTDTVEAWGKKTNATSEEIATKTDKEMERLRKSLIKHGFKAADIDKFMNVNAGWVPAWKRVGDQANAAGRGIGKDLAAGVKQSLEASAAALGLAAADLMRATENAARKEADTHSPSKKWYLIGLDLTEGLKKGLVEGFPILDTVVKDKIAGLEVTALGTIAQVPAAMTDAFKAHQSKFTDAILNYQDIFRQRMDAIKAMAKSYSDQVTSALSFQQTKTIQVMDGDKLVDKIVPMTPEEMMKAMFGDIENQANMVQAVVNNIGTKLPPALLSKIMEMPPETAIALADYLGNNPDQIDRLAWNYKGLAKYTENALGTPMGEAWALIGDQSANDMLLAAKLKLDKEAENFRTWVKKKLKTEIVVDVVYREVNKPAAVGGMPAVQQIQQFESLNGRAWRS